MGLKARPRPTPVRLTLKQRRAMSVCEFFSAKNGREVIVPARGYWLGLWLDWAPQAIAYVELPSKEDSPKEWVADYWVQFGEDEFLIDVVQQTAKPKYQEPKDAWALDDDGFELSRDGVSRITSRWLWARRTLVANLEQAHPYAVAAQLQGGLKATCRTMLNEWRESDRTVADALNRAGASAYVSQCALFHAVRSGHFILEWNKPLTLGTAVRRAPSAP